MVVKWLNVIKINSENASLLILNTMKKAYSKLFYIDPSLCFYCTSKNKIFAGVLGINFLKRHKWTIDLKKIRNQHLIQLCTQNSFPIFPL